jgi:hypothetical protein
MRQSRRQFVLTSTGLAAAAGVAHSEVAAMTRASKHIVLVGDSIFDNGVYVPGKPSVIDQLRAELGDRGKATLLARDGDVTASISGQLAGIPDDATHLMVSVGGNDALAHTDLLDKPIKNSAELLADLAAIHAQFGKSYAQMLATVARVGKPVAVCTIYDSNFAPPTKQLADVALSVFNDCILRCAGDAGVPVLDLRRLFRRPQDYANPIEPSEIGGAKMVKAIVALCGEHDFTKRRTSLYP